MVAPVQSRRQAASWAIYDAFVVWMRRLLPAIAVLLALLVILFPGLRDREVSFTLSQEDIVVGQDQVRMVNPSYRGTDSLGRFFRIAAQSGLQASPDDPQITLTGITGEMELDAETKALLFSDSGLFLPDDQELRLDGDVLIETTDGNRFTARAAVMNLDNKIARSDAAVAGSGPLGSFVAQSFEIHVDEAVAIFEGGVRMRVDPTGRLDLPLFGNGTQP